MSDKTTRYRKLRYFLEKHKIETDTKASLIIKAKNFEREEESIIGTIVESTAKMMNVLFIIGENNKGKPVYRSLGKNTRVVYFELLD
ncbi:MAG: hypothetical protein KAQ64_03030 [Candidatus Pacebacteria bacterium]|nr:hypothetical protein [Candidatus Paceibacterota bacterium]